MNSRRRNGSEDLETVSERHSRVNAGGFSLTIPMDLIIDIFLRLPLKSIARCRSVSKLWASTLRRSDFTELFLTRPLARPQLLFARGKPNEVVFFSSLLQYPEDSSPIATANDHMAFHFDRVKNISSPICGLVCIRDNRILKGRKTREVVSLICNPSTGQSFTLPKMKTKKRTNMLSFLGYDPIGKQHKVLGMLGLQDRATEHQVLTLGGTHENLTWRMCECDIPHSSPWQYYVCINGVLYYPATDSNGRDIIVCFHVRSEKYSYVKAMRASVHPPATLVNYNGTLASVMSQTNPYHINGNSTSFEMWVLQDPEKHEWSSRVFKLPPAWKVVPTRKYLLIVGVTDTNEMVLSSYSSSDAFHVYFYNFERETVRRVEIQGMRTFDGVSRIHTFMGYVENLKLM